MDDLTKQLNKMASGAKKLEQKETLSFGEIFTDSFAQRNTSFNTMSDFWHGAGIHSTEDYDAYPDYKLDQFVKSHSHFSTFEEMFNEAVNTYIAHQLGF